MRHIKAVCVPRVLSYPHAVAERLLSWSEDARRNRRFARADRLLLAAWEAFDRSSGAELAGRSSDGQAVDDHAAGQTDQAVILV